MIRFKIFPRSILLTTVLFLVWCGTLMAQANVTIGANCTITQSSSTIQVYGNWINNGTYTVDTNGEVLLNGTSEQSIEGATVTTFEDLTIENAAGVTLGQDLNIDGVLNFLDGPLTLNSFDLTINSGGAIIGYDDAKFIIADAAGFLIQEVISFNPVVFPVGTSEAAARASRNNGGDFAASTPTPYQPVQPTRTGSKTSHLKTAKSAKPVTTTHAKTNTLAVNKHLPRSSLPAGNEGNGSTGRGSRAVGSYTPASLDNQGTTDNFKVRVFPMATEDGTAAGAQYTNDVVNMTWVVEEELGGGSDLELTLQWNSADEAPGFDRTQCGIGHYTGAAWDPQIPAGSAGGADPYTRIRADITTLSSFAVGDSESPLSIIPTLIIDNVAISEENFGTVNADFTVTLSHSIDQTVTVDYSTADGTATTVDNDYTGISATTLTFNPTETVKTVTVNVNGDNKVESNETFFVNLSTPTGPVTIAVSQGQGTINNDDSAEFSIADVTDQEANGPFNLTVELSNPVDVATSLQVSTVDGTATIADGDYTGVTNQTVNFAANATSGSFLVTIASDNRVEADETFSVTLSNLDDGGYSGDVTLGNGGIHTIQNDDSAEFSIADVTDLEANGPFTLTVSLSNPVSTATSLNVSTVDGTATVTDGDYNAITNQTINFPALSVSQTFSLTVNDDVTLEADENLSISLSGLNDGGFSAEVTLGSGGTHTIQNDDSAVFTVANFSDLESNGPFTLTVSLTIPVDIATSVDVSTGDGSATIVDTDYNAVANQTINFPANSTGQTFDVIINNDNKVEADETFVISLSNLNDGGYTGGITLGSGGTHTIQNDDSAVFSISSVDQNEDQAPFRFTISLSNPVDSETSVTANTADGSATVANGDYDQVSAETIIFNAGETSHDLDISGVPDYRVEPNEVFSVTIGELNPGGYPGDVTILGGAGTGNIRNDDTAGVTITESEGSTVVSEGGLTDTYDLVLTSEPYATVTITIDPDGQTNLGGGVDNPIFLTFDPVSPNAWNIPQTVTITAFNDAFVELTHYSTITHASASTDNDYNGPNPVFTPGSTLIATILENDAGIGNFVWRDLDGDGVQDVAETGLPNITVDLYNPAHVLVQSTITDINGFYRLLIDADTNFYLQFTSPGPTFFISPQDAGSDNIDSDANPSNGRTDMFSFLPGAIIGHLDCGFYQADFSDAPDTPYQTYLTSNGARHVIDGLTYLGSTIDAEPDGLPTSDCLGDDNSIDDEDGITN
ncbi:MAG: hypothetical protein GY869_13845, partial [Planctomycetes bacterium]|nr:hypothetical protein [Planctomycetota bacterium]